MSALTDTAQRQLAGRLGGLSLLQQIRVLALWPLLEQALSYMVTFVDTVQSGHLDASAVTAVGVAGYVVWILGMIQSAVGVGSTALIARASGAGRRSLANATLGQSLSMAAVAGVIAGAGLFLLAEPICHFVELDGPALADGTVFLSILALATPLSFVLFVGNACLRGAGDTATPFRIMVLVNIVNVAANLAFVLGPAPLGQHGVAGIAAATGFAWLVGTLAIVAFLIGNRGGIRLYPHRLLPRWPLVRRVVRIGIPNLIEASGFWGAQFLVLKIIGHVGQLGLTDALAMHSVAVRVELVNYLPGVALSTAAATLAGQYLGIGDAARAQQAVRLCWYICMAIMGLVGLVFLAMPRPLIALMTNDPAILREAPTLLRICGPSEVFMASYLVLSQAMRGAGDTRTPMLLSYFSIFCVRLPAAYLLGVVLGGGLVGIWFALCGEVAFRGILFAARFLHGGWLRVRV